VAGASRGRAESAYQPDQELDLAFRPVVLVTDEAREREHGLGSRTRLVVKQVRHQLVGHVAEEIDDR
jgi:hypothetical protein